MLDWATRKARGEQAADAKAPETGDGSHPPELIDAPKPKPQQQGIGLALGGGAARGWAHIGVLRALDEAGIKIDMIAGTSIGALVGGCYLAGKLDELEEFALGLTRRRMFGLLDLHIGGAGLFGGMRLTQRMREHMDGVTFEGLDRPFVCVATEIDTGHEIWLSSGHLINAMRASYALPGVFEPVRLNGRLLVDGALVNPCPVSVCRAYEKRMVVAVNLAHDMFGRSAVIKVKADESIAEVGNVEEASARNQRLGITGVMVEAFNIIQDRISRARMAGDPPDLMLSPELGPIALTDFHRARESIDLGYEAAISRLAELQRIRAALA
ncbi:MAG: patatin-like phospholipase family protein [Brucellaceae bacterium]|nr:patatin-like phospholipase family protein [Brucellaceae bacterium]